MRIQTTTPQGLHRLSATGINRIRTPGWHGDGGGLYLEVDAGGRKRWAMRLTVNGKRCDFGLGPLHKVSLLEARARAAEYRAKAYRGIDPREDTRVPTPVAKTITFEAAADQVHQQRRAAWSNGKHVEQWINTLRDHTFPILGKMLVNEIGTPVVLRVLSPIWNTKPETARRVRQRIAVVLEWARAAGYRSGVNPIELIGDALPRHKGTDRHHAALHYEKVPTFIAQLRAGPSEPITKLAFEFLILTASRTADVRSALRHEINRVNRTWTIPGKDENTGRRMKAGREHVVPLSDRALEILTEAETLNPGADLIFPDAQTGRAMSENRFLIARDALAYDKSMCTPHGFRSSFRDWAAEETSFPPEVAEMALAHKIASKVEAAYRRGNLLAKRRQLMEAWAGHLALKKS